MFKNLTIGKKLYIAFGVVLFLMIAVSAFTVLQLYGIVNNTSELKERIDKIDSAATIRRAVLSIYNNVRDLTMTKDPKAREEIKSEIESLRKTYRERIDSLKAVTRSEEGKALIKNLEDALVSAREETNKIISLAMEGKRDEAQEIIIAKLRQHNQILMKHLDNVVEFNKKRADKRVSEIVSSGKTEIVILIASTIVAVIIALFFAFLIIKSIRKPVEEIRQAMERVGQGDFTVKITAYSKDELGQIAESTSKAIESIKSLIAESKTIATSLASSSEQLSATTEEISRNLKSQTERASQIASAAEEMSQTVVDIAKNAAQIAEASNVTAQVAKDGKEMTTNTAQEIKLIEGAINKLSEVINVLADRSRQIGEIVTVIKDIADQTNLLALNAAIEAARAGEQGRGFAVVADEVRKLAERTAKATDEIAEMIRGIQAEVGVAEGSMEDATKKVASGVELSNKSAQMLGQILAKAQELQGMIQQIASATEEMSSVTDHITQDIGSIAEGSKEISLAVDQSAQTASDIARLGGELNSAIGRFRV